MTAVASVLPLNGAVGISSPADARPRQRGEVSIPELPEIDMCAAEAAVRDLLIAIGEDPDREGLLDTPTRVAKALVELTAGRWESPDIHLARQFSQEYDEVVVLKDIEFNSMCEHHLLPFTGRAHVAYLPGNGKVVGLSKLARVVDVYARRPQLQERLTNQIAEALVEHLRADGVAVLVQAEHMCMKLRGVQKSEPVMETLAMRGVFKTDSDMRREILDQLQRRHLAG